MRIHICVVLASAAALTGCASIVNGQNQSVSVETRSDAGPLPAAKCTLINDKGTWFVTTPGTTTVQRSYGDLAVRCEKDAHESGFLAVKSFTKPMAFGNIIFGGVIGAGVDVATGAAYDYPTLITVLMGKASAPASTPSAAAPAPVSAAAPSAAASAAL